MQRRRVSSAVAVAVILLTAMEEIENPMGVTMHEDAREAVERIQRGIFPKDFSGNGQRRIAHVPMKTSGVPEPVAGVRDTRYDGRIEASVRIGKMRHGLAEFLLQRQQRAHDLI